MKNKRWGYICLAVIIIALLGGAYLSKKPAKIDVPAPVGQDEENVPEADTTDSPVVEGEEAPKEADVGETQGTLKEPEKTQPEETKPFWQSETSRQINNLTAIATAGQSDYKVNGAKRGWMSKNGKLYNQFEGRYITTDMLVADGYLEQGLASAEYEIMLVNGSDLAEIEGVTVPDASMDFGVFAATKQSGKYLIASPAGKVGQISEGEYKTLLGKYNQNHGNVVRLSSTSAEYSRILNYISLFEGRLDDYYVREIRKDDKYAVAIFSSRGDVADVKQYILQNDNNFWEVVMPNTQMEYYPVTAINQYLPDFNVELLPNYTLASWRGSITKEQSGAIAALFNGQYITSSEEVVYQCSTASCSYVMLRNGKRYACYKEGGVWKAEYVDSDLSAKKLFMEKTGVDYGFLILDD